MNKTLLAAALVIGGATLFAGDVLRFRGENSQGVFEEKGLMKTWPQEGLTPKWIYTGLGEGWSSPIKVGNCLYITGSDMNAKKEMVVCLDLNGKKVWQTATGSRWERAYAEQLSGKTGYRSFRTCTRFRDISPATAPPRRKSWSRSIPGIPSGRCWISTAR